MFEVSELSLESGAKSNWFHKLLKYSSRSPTSTA